MMESKTKEIQSVLGKFLKAALPPTTVGVIITGFIAPFVVTKITSGIENKKIQTDLVSKILEMTKDTNFDDEKQLKRYMIYGQIVKDNPELFSIKLDQTLEKANSLFNPNLVAKNSIALDKNALDSLKNKKMEYAGKLLSLNQKFNDNELSSSEKNDLEKEIIKNSNLIINTHAEIEKKETDLQEKQAELFRAEK